MRTAVLIRAHNYGHLLSEAVESALGQSRPPAHIVVVDDGSSDSTASVVRALKERVPNLRAVRNEEPVGPARAMNQAASMSDAEFLLPLDADDRLSPGFIELTEDALLKSGDDVAHTAVKLFGARSEWRPARPITASDLRVENGLVVSCLMKRWVYDAVGGFSPAFDSLCYEDWSFWLTAWERGARFRAVDGCWLEYRQHKAGSRNSISRMTSLAAHWRMYRTHPSMTLNDLLRWMGRSARRNLLGRVR